MAAGGKREKEREGERRRETERDGERRRETENACQIEVECSPQKMLQNRSKTYRFGYGFVT